MEYEFTNGSAEQKRIWEEALGHLLSLPSSSVNEKIIVTFQDSIPGGHTDLALTTWSYDSTEATTLVRSDALSFGPSQEALEAEAAALGIPYSVEKFYLETAIHELGHALFASLPQEHRVKIAEMFGASSDSIEELQPEGSRWQNRIMEGIAETFKEAFLPHRFRVFPNRTNRKIPYGEYSTFRSYWRKGIESVPATEGFNHDVLELDFKDMRTAWPLSATFRHEAGNSYYTVYEAGYNLFARMIPVAHTFAFSFEPPSLPIATPLGTPGAAIIFGWRYIIKVNGLVQDRFRGVWGYGRPSNPEAVEFWARFWLPASQEWDEAGDRVNENFSAWMKNSDTFFVPNEFEHGGEGFIANYQTWEDARAIGALPAHLSSSVAVQAGDAVSIHARAIGLEWSIPGGPNFEKEAKERMGRLEPPWSEALPLMRYAEPGAEGGESIVLPSGLVIPTGVSAGARPRGRPVVGNQS